jgi:hypothetical protein
MDLEHHATTIRVEPAAGGSRVTYDVDVVPDHLLDLLVGTYGPALAALKDKAETEA